MRYLSGAEEQEAMGYIDDASKMAVNSSCFRSKCGSLIVKGKEVIGSGFNSPPLDKKIDKCLKDDLPINFKSDKNCCIHAEQRAIMEALQNNANKLKGSRLYFIRLDASGAKEPAGRPYCTICSKMALESGIAEFVLWHNTGICVYDTDEYNRISFQYRE